MVALADRLRASGVDAWLDSYEPAPAEGGPRWFMHQLATAEAILVVCSEALRRGFDGEPTSKATEWALHWIVQILYEAGARNQRLIPVLLDETGDTALPRVLQAYVPYRWPSQFEALVRRLTGQPTIVPAQLPPRAPAPGARIERETLPSLKIRVWAQTVAYRSATRDIAVVPPVTDEQFAVGDSIIVYFAASQRCHVVLVNEGSSGRSAVIFPNTYAGCMEVAAGDVRRLPDVFDDFEFRLSGPPGTDVIRAFASPSPVVAGDVPTMILRLREQGAAEACCLMTIVAPRHS